MKRRALAVARHAGRDFLEDAMPLHAAALAFFALLAVVPLFALAIAGASVWLGDGEEARARLEDGASTLLGGERADALNAIIEGASPGGGTGITLAFTALLLLFAATRLFAALEASMNVVWDVKAEPAHGLWKLLRKRLASFGMLLGTGFLLLVALGVGSMTRALFPESGPLWTLGRLALSFLVSWAVIAGLYWRFPDAEVELKDAARAGAAVALLLTLGERGLGLLMGGDHMEAVYGGLAAVIASLLWFYYASLLLLLGAEATHAMASTRGEKPRPDETSTHRGEKRHPAPSRP